MPDDLRATPASEIPLFADPRSRIADHFTLRELTRSQIAQRDHIDNAFAERSHLEAAVHLAREVMQPIRDAFGPLTPNSVYRGQALERALKNKPAGWISRSQHARGEACDLEVASLSTLEFAEWVAKNLDYDQLICECYNPAAGLDSGWVHISLAPPGKPNRNQPLSYIWDTSEERYVYVSGLVSSVA